MNTTFNWLEWTGYIASGIILISLLMSSVKRLRWINTIGSAVFAVYGLLIGSIPVAVMNLGIIGINIFYLVQMFTQKEYFKILSVSTDSEYLKNFVRFYADDISKIADFNENKIEGSEIRFFILRNMVVAGVFLCSKHDEQTLKIELDFATPSYRDFKIGRFIFKQEKSFFIEKGYTKFITETKVDSHINYLKKMGFEYKEENGGIWAKKLL